MRKWASLSNPACTVSSDGRIFSVRRDIRSSRLKCGYLSAPFEHSTFLCKGYKCVRLKGKSYQVHQLVAKAFLGECPKGCNVDHIDRDRLNNDISNLRYATFKENALNRSVCDEAQKRLGGYSSRSEYNFKRLASKGLYKTQRNGKTVILPISIRRTTCHFSTSH